MNYFFLIDKPIGITSFDVIRKLRKKLNIKKMGHTGTLDPLATGGLLIATGVYTKLIPYFEKDTKEYEFSVKFDGKTDSFDLATEVNFLDEKTLEKAKKTITKEYLEDILKNKFTGKIKQLPPKYSALKISGKKAVDLVREGKEVELKKRECEIFSIKIIDFSFPLVSFKAKVSAGTYIRSIAAELGEELKTGGYVTNLRRSKIGNLDISLSTNLESLEKTNSLFVTKLFPKDYFITLPDNTLEKINNGLPVFGDFDFKIGKNLFVFDGKQITNVVFYDGEKLLAKRKIV
ncbi:tRNA pseudouridine(55) synthase TruB [Candidatus Gracilibacteria bacterium]|nr:MAG: tRNA pseudouridine(55) synthase TruB [Candidatus Gracilibacteria bacterium]